MPAIRVGARPYRRPRETGMRKWGSIGGSRYGTPGRRLHRAGFSKTKIRPPGGEMRNLGQSVAAALSVCNVDAPYSHPTEFGTRVGNGGFNVGSIARRVANFRRLQGKLAITPSPDCACWHATVYITLFRCAVICAQCRKSKRCRR